MTDRPIDLTDWQARAIAALEPGETFLLIEPLEVQLTDDAHVYMNSLTGNLRWFPNDPRNVEDGGPVILPHAIGDRLLANVKEPTTGDEPLVYSGSYWCEREIGTLEVTGVTVKRDPEHDNKWCAFTEARKI